MSDIEVVIAAMLKITYNFSPVIIGMIAWMAWDSMGSPRKARLRKNNNIK
jgi:hypothetical protein